MTGQDFARADRARLGYGGAPLIRLGTFGEPASLMHGEHAASGLVLRRKETGKSQELLLFLNKLGATWVSAPGTGAKNRFGAGTEPMMWGEFRLYQSPRRLYLKGVDVREDFWAMRGSPKTLRTAVKWCGELASRLIPGTQADSLLSLLWGSMKNLSSGLYPALLDIRFAWRWGNLWGLAPPLDACSSCGAKLGSEGDALFQMTSDGFMCRNCAEEAQTSGSAVIVGRLSTAEHDILQKAATLPKDKFLAWATNAPPPDSNLAARASWLYSFISVT
ncbi:MAG: DNA repair protein RecO C-terminal domain-containing protein [Synergistaceae bacterium]|jgi:DNA repair protein RecO (recombination protein O)|nr:DNA repair protein RecO C-terminal domain-containing protein [Synergistaceae bacterium]